MKLDANDKEAIWKKAVCARGEEAHLRDDVFDLINDLREARGEAEWLWKAVDKTYPAMITERDNALLAAKEETKQLKAQLQDALTVISDALTDVMDMIAVSEMERRDMDLCPQATMLSLHDDLHAAIQRLQEETQDE